MIKINYTPQHWKILEKLREKTTKMIEPLTRNHINAYAYGSIARGDIHPESDIDIYIPTPPATSIIETHIEQAGYKIQNREIIQATPAYAPKGYIYLDEKSSYSFPLIEMKTVEQEFYMFAGMVSTEKLRENIRVPGIDKRLMFIEPTDFGHIESHIDGKEGSIAKRLNINVQTIHNRVKTLRRREVQGRTGVYIKTSLRDEESFGEVYNQLSLSRPALRRRQRRK